MEEQQVVTIIFSKSNFQRNNLYTYLMDKYIDAPEETLTEAMKMLTLSMMRPDLAFEQMKVSTYKELVDRVVLEVAYGRRVDVLDSIEREMINKFGSINVSKFAAKLSFI